MVVPGAHLIHIPSGLKFLLVLVFGLTGALSIFSVSLAASLWFYFPNSPMVSLELALINALSPLLTRRIYIDKFSLNDNLSNLNWKKLLHMGLLFSFLNSVMNQLVLYWNDISQELLQGIQVMFVGDITGVTLTLVLIKILLWVFKPKLDI
jgi:hypothetical protein